MAVYFAGYTGGFTIDGFDPDLFKFNNWTYTKDKDLLDVTSSRSNGRDQFIGNLDGGTIQGSGFMTEEQRDEINNLNLNTGDEIVLNLYFDKTAPAIGFEGIDAVIESFNIEMANNGTATWTLNAQISEPK